VPFLVFVFGKVAVTLGLLLVLIRDESANTREIGQWIGVNLTCCTRQIRLHGRLPSTAYWPVKQERVQQNSVHPNLGRAGVVVAIKVDI